MIEAAADPDRLEEYRRVAAFQRHLGLEVHEISPAEIADLFPWARTDDLLAGFLVPGDGRVNPVDLTMSLAKGARASACGSSRASPSTDVLTVAARHRGARGSTADDRVRVRRQLHRHVGPRARGAERLVIPNQAAEHYYLITDTIEGIDPDAPIFEDPSSYGYYREEGGGMMVGLFEPEGRGLAGRRDPERLLVRHVASRLGPDGALPGEGDGARAGHHGGRRTNVLLRPGVVHPRPGAAVGEAPGHPRLLRRGRDELRRRAVGRRARARAGALDHDGRARRRRHRFQRRPVPHGPARARYRATRTTEILGTVYAAHTPASSCAPRATGCSRPVHERLVEQGGYLREVSGWEGADWFAGPGMNTERRADVGTCAVVRAVGARAPHRPRVRRADGHVVHGQVPGGRAPTPASCSTGCQAGAVNGDPGTSPTPSGSTTTGGSRPTSP